MELRLFKIHCLEQKCGYEFFSNSKAHTICPICGAENLAYRDDVMVEGADLEDSLENYLSYAIETIEDFALAFVIANAYITDETCLARKDSFQGFRLNVKPSEFLQDQLYRFNMPSIDAFKLWLEKSVDLTAALIYDPVFRCIYRESYSDEEGNLYESGHINYSDAKRVFKWLMKHDEELMTYFEL